MPSPNSALVAARPATVLSDTEQLPAQRPESRLPDRDISSQKHHSDTTTDPRMARMRDAEVGAPLGHTGDR
jgi:hypothetical protein